MVSGDFLLVFKIDALAFALILRRRDMLVHNSY